MAKTSLSKLVDEENAKTTKSTTEKTETVKEKTKRVFEPNDYITCRSITQGALYIEGEKTNMLYEWSRYGDEIDVEYRDLVAWVRSKSPFIFNPNIIVEDNDFVEEFEQLRRFYAQAYSVKDLKKILDLPVDKMIAEIKVLPKTAYESIAGLASSGVANGTIDSVKKIKALDELFDTDLSLLSDLFQ